MIIRKLALALSMTTVCAHMYPANALPRNAMTESENTRGLKIQSKKIARAEKLFERQKARQANRMARRERIKARQTLRISRGRNENSASLRLENRGRAFAYRLRLGRLRGTLLPQESVNVAVAPQVLPSAPTPIDREISVAALQAPTTQLNTILSETGIRELLIPTQPEMLVSTVVLPEEGIQNVSEKLPKESVNVAVASQVLPSAPTYIDREIEIAALKAPITQLDTMLSETGMRELLIPTHPEMLISTVVLPEEGIQHVSEKLLQESFNAAVASQVLPSAPTYIDREIEIAALKAPITQLDTILPATGIREPLIPTQPEMLISTVVLPEEGIQGVSGALSKESVNVAVASQILPLAPTNIDSEIEVAALKAPITQLDTILPETGMREPLIPTHSEMLVSTVVLPEEGIQSVSGALSKESVNVAVASQILPLAPTNIDSEIEVASLKAPITPLDTILPETGMREPLIPTHSEMLISTVVLPEEGIQNVSEKLQQESVNVAVASQILPSAPTNIDSEIEVASLKAPITPLDTILPETGMREPLIPTQPEMLISTVVLPEEGIQSVSGVLPTQGNSLSMVEIIVDGIKDVKNELLTVSENLYSSTEQLLSPKKETNKDGINNLPTAAQPNIESVNSNLLDAETVQSNLLDAKAKLEELHQSVQQSQFRIYFSPINDLEKLKAQKEAVIDIINTLQKNRSSLASLEAEREYDELMKGATLTKSLIYASSPLIMTPRDERAEMQTPQFHTPTLTFNKDLFVLNLEKTKSKLKEVEKGINRIKKESYNGHFPGYFAKNYIVPLQNQKESVEKLLSISSEIEKGLFSSLEYLENYGAALPQKDLNDEMRKIKNLEEELFNKAESLFKINHTIFTLGNTISSPLEKKNSNITSSGQVSQGNEGITEQSSPLTTDVPLLTITAAINDAIERHSPRPTGSPRVGFSPRPTLSPRINTSPREKSSPRSLTSSECTLKICGVKHTYTLKENKTESFTTRGMSSENSNKKHGVKPLNLGFLSHNNSSIIKEEIQKEEKLASPIVVPQIISEMDLQKVTTMVNTLISNSKEIEMLTDEEGYNYKNFLGNNSQRLRAFLKGASFSFDVSPRGDLQEELETLKASIQTFQLSEEKKDINAAKDTMYSISLWGEYLLEKIGFVTKK
ncbi:MAG: hypothetical protein H0X26_06440 [Alphaproteobacteria bacterium]|nr:hypothetical protein [Alphaproteobacteria bacterium]